MTSLEQYAPGNLSTPLAQQYQIRISQELEDKAWDQFLAQTSGGHHVQTSLWARVKATLGWRVVRLVVMEEDKIVGGAQIMMRRLPLLGMVGYVSKAPLLATSEPGLDALVVTELKRLARKERIQHITIQPPGDGDQVVPQLIDQGFRPGTTSVAPRATLLLDLSQDLDTIMAEMSRRTRYNIRLSGRKGITVREGTEQDLDAYYAMLTETGQRQNFMPYPQRYFTEMWRYLQPLGYLKLFVAEYEGDTVAAQLAVPFGDTVINKLSVWSGREGNRRPNEAVQWACISWAKAHGYRYYDFEGIKPAAAEAINRGEALPESLKQTVTSYKLGFGGQAILYAQPYVYLYNPLFRWTFNELYPRIKDRKVVKKALKRLRTQ